MKPIFKIFGASLFLVTICFSLSAQRLEIPLENPDNGLKLNAVYQNYEIVTTSGQYGQIRNVEKDKLLLLKINDSYISNDDTGIHEASFYRYLKNCPKALDLGLDGLDTYKSARKLRTMSNVAGYGLMGLGLIGLSQGLSSLGGLGGTSTLAPSSLSPRFTISLGLLIGGGATRYFMRKASKNRRYQANDEVIEAINLYTAECYDATVAPPIEETETESTTKKSLDKKRTVNGVSNANEIIDMDILSNDPGKLLFGFAPSLKFYMLDEINAGIGGQFFLQKSGFFAELSAYKSFGFGTLDEDLAQGLSQRRFDLDVGFPIFGRTKNNAEQIISLGRAFGIESNGMLKDVKQKRFVSIIGGLTNYHSFSLVSLDFKDYHVTSNLAKAGISWGLLNHTVYRVNDNRFDDKLRYTLNSALLYAQVVYNLNTEYNLLSTSFFYDDPSHSDIGYAIGLRYKNSGKSKRRYFGLNLELGLYPVNNDIKGFGFDLGFQYGLYKKT